MRAQRMSTETTILRRPPFRGYFEKPSRTSPELTGSLEFLRLNSLPPYTFPRYTRPTMGLRDPHRKSIYAKGASEHPSIRTGSER
jgi:hypothetical protein